VLDVLVEGVKTAYEARRLSDTDRWLDRALPELRQAEDARAIELLAIAATMANLRGDVEAARVAAHEVETLRREALRESTRPGGTLRIGYASRTQTRYISGKKYTTWAEREFTSCVVETLVSVDSGANACPRLAESWEASTDHRSFTFTLRAGIRFHDGRVLCARDVADSFQRSIKGASALAQAFSRLKGVAEFISGANDHVSGIVVESENRIRLELDLPLPAYPVLLTDLRTAIRGSDRDPLGQPRERLIGTGPFAVLEARTGDGGFELTRNVDYWSGAPKLERMEMFTFESADDVVDAFRNGRIDVAMDLPVEHVDQLLADRRAGARFVELNRRETRFLLFNTGRPFGRSEAARRALFGSMPVDAMVWRHVGPSAQPGATLIPPGLAGHDPSQRRTRLTIEEAREMIPVDVPKQLTIATSPVLYQRFPALIDAVCDHARELGLEVTLFRCTPEEFATVHDDPSEVDLFVLGWRADHADAANFTHDLFHSKRGVFAAYIATPELDAVLTESLMEASPERRVTASRAADRALVDTAVVLPLLVGIDPCVVRADVLGLEARVLPPFISYDRASIRRAEAQRSRWGWISIPLSERVSELDPASTATMQRMEIVRCCFEGLARETHGAEVTEWLAESIQSEDGDRRYRIRLRDDLRFHDGRKVTAWHVKSSWERTLARRGARSLIVLGFVVGAAAVADGSAKELSGVTISSPLELTVQLDRPIPLFLAMLADSSTIVLCEQLDGAGKNGIECLGTGPFRVRSFEPGERVELEANPYYWQRGYPKSDGITFSLGVPHDEALRRFRADQVTLLSDSSIGDAPVADENATMTEVPALLTTCLVFNTRSGPFSNVAARRAVTRAVDPAQLAREHLPGRVLPALGYLPPGVLGHVPRPIQREAATDSTRFDAPVRIALWPAVRKFPNYCDALVTQLARAGLTLEVLRLEAGELPERVDLVVSGWIANYADADSMVRAALHSQDGAWGSFCGHPDVDELCEQAVSTKEPDIRRDLYQRIEERIADHCLLVPLFHDNRRWLAQKAVRGLSAEQTGLARGIDLAALWIERRSEPRD
jgi:ABC-type transport system substrate-binding protein